jgi:hypothetical protein
MILDPAPPTERERIEIHPRPNIKQPPIPPPLPDDMTGQVLIVLPDNISTGSMTPDGAIVMADRSPDPRAGPAAPRATGRTGHQRGRNPASRGGPGGDPASSNTQTVVDLTDASHHQTLIDAAVATLKAGRAGRSSPDQEPMPAARTDAHTDHTAHP